jgi:formiminotetrahydrofolate cyclodeaminase
VRENGIDEWLGDLASRSPTPGGGAAAALCAATAAALVSMVAVYTTGQSWADRAEEMATIDARAADLRGRALALAEADAAAFGLVGSAYGLPRATREDQAARQAAIQAALLVAAGPPRDVGANAIAILDLAGGLVERGNPNVLSDVAVASSLARAALESAIVNIEINRSLITDEDVRLELAEAVESLEASMTRADEITASVRAKLQRP